MPDLKHLIAETRRLREAATTAKKCFVVQYPSFWSLQLEDGYDSRDDMLDLHCCQRAKENAEFFAHCYNNITPLLDYIEGLEQEVDRRRSKWKAAEKLIREILTYTDAPSSMYSGWITQLHALRDNQLQPRSET